MSEMDIQHPTILRGAIDLDDANGGLNADVSAFDTELAGYGQPWGKDTLGSLIGECYQNAYGLAMNCLATNAEEFDRFVGGMRITHGTYLQAEEDSGRDGGNVEV